MAETTSGDGMRVRLTQTVKKGGCAAKIAAGTLSGLLASLPSQKHPNLLVGTDYLDDAAAWRINGEQAMIQTLDFFTPVVDDPADFGAIAAANAVSDVFAMGAEPVTALTILAYPIDTLGGEVLQEMMLGATATINAAGAQLVGGHSIDDDTLKLGFSVTGISHPDSIWSNRGARPGDALVLTKAIGTGTLMGALKNDEVQYSDLSDALSSMKTVNRLDLPGNLRQAVHAATDVTGFGVLGHALHIAQGSGMSLEIEAARVPLLEGAHDTLARGILTKAHVTTTQYVAQHVVGREALSEEAWWSLVDPQTSGGLLLSVDPDQVDALLEAIKPAFPRAGIIGHVTEPQSGKLHVR